MSETIETVNFEPGKKHYMSWPVIALIDFVTIISFENIFYPFQNYMGSTKILLAKIH